GSPHYTRPPEFRGAAVPDVLRSGDHAKIETARRRWAWEKTAKNRPDLLGLTPEVEPGMLTVDRRSAEVKKVRDTGGDDHLESVSGDG
ncbi:hypothetical protein JW848_08565, partial [Candidatus Bipolaricaulota bacterium]|nr:hypothetical protein [Candidatus Bipolaricaulota bacterium]